MQLRTRRSGILTTTAACLSLGGVLLAQSGFGGPRPFDPSRVRPVGIATPARMRA